MARLRLTAEHAARLEELAGHLAFMARVHGKECGDYIEACIGGGELIKAGLADKARQSLAPDALPTNEDWKNEDQET